MKCKHSKEVSTRALVFRLLMVLYIASVAVLCFAKFDSLPDVEKFIFGIPTDKIVHFCMFFPFPILCYFVKDKHRKTIASAFVFFVMIASFGCIFAGITEIIQGTLPYRSEDILDFGADCLSICLSSVIVLIAYLLYVRKNK